MPYRGQLIGTGLLDGARFVRVFEDLDSDRFVFASMMDRDEELFVAAERIQLDPRGAKRSNAVQ